MDEKLPTALPFLIQVISLDLQTDKPLARPFTKIEATLNTRNISTGASKPQNEIWTAGEIRNIKDEEVVDDSRVTPEYEVR